MLTFVLGVITGLAVREIADYLPASSHFSRTTLRSSSGRPSASEKGISTQAAAIEPPECSAGVGRKLRRIAYPGVSRLDDLRKPNRFDRSLQSACPELAKPPAGC
jgi:hypothetical protein